MNYKTAINQQPMSLLHQAAQPIKRRQVTGGGDRSKRTSIHNTNHMNNGSNNMGSSAARVANNSLQI